VAGALLTGLLVAYRAGEQKRSNINKSKAYRYSEYQRRREGEFLLLR
jgi:hypothetical protein